MACSYLSPNSQVHSLPLSVSLNSLQLKITNTCHPIGRSKRQRKNVKKKTFKNHELCMSFWGHKDKIHSGLFWPSPRKNHSAKRS